MSKVIVCIPKNEDGTAKHAIIRPSTTKPEWGSVMVKSTSFTMTNGIINERSRAAYFRAPLVLLNKLNLKEGADLSALLGTELRIARKETNIPQYEGHRQKMNPQTKENIFVGGQPVFLQDSVEAANVADQLITADAGVAAPAVVSGEAGQVF